MNNIYLLLGVPILYCIPEEPLANVAGGSPLNVPHLDTPEKGVLLNEPPVTLPDKLGNPPIDVFILQVPGKSEKVALHTNQYISPPVTVGLDIEVIFLYPVV